jgi:fructoselysine transporter
LATQLPRRLSLVQATAINMIDMVGIGPFVTLPIVIQLVGGPHFLYAWIAGAVLSLVDAMIWSEYGAALPLAGGTYNFLKEAYGPGKWGKMFSFLFTWQTCIQAPLVIASAAIGFSSYLSYFHPLNEYAAKAVSGLVVIGIVLLLYRKIDDIGKISVLLWVGVLATMAWIIGGGIWQGNMAAPWRHLNDTATLGSGLVAAIGFASVKTVYSFLGYYNVCHLGGEIKNPERNIPRSMFISIVCITLLYLGMNTAVTSVIPWNVAKDNKYVVSSFIEAISGRTAAGIATILILWVAFASVFSATLGYSRIPYAAAADGSFFKVFARLHPTKNFPHISLLVLGAVAFCFSLLFRIEAVISAILAMRIVVQFVGQALGLFLLRRKKKERELLMPYQMPLYPLPIIIAIALWLFIFFSTGWQFMLGGLTVIVTGAVAYFVLAKQNNWWPYATGSELLESDDDEDLIAGKI